MIHHVSFYSIILSLARTKLTEIEHSAQFPFLYQANAFFLKAFARKRVRDNFNDNFVLMVFFLFLLISDDIIGAKKSHTTTSTTSKNRDNRWFKRWTEKFIVFTTWYTARLRRGMSTAFVPSVSSPSAIGISATTTISDNDDGTCSRTNVNYRQCYYCYWHWYDRYQHRFLTYKATTTRILRALSRKFDKSLSIWSLCEKHCVASTVHMQYCHCCCWAIDRMS